MKDKVPNQNLVHIFFLCSEKDRTIKKMHFNQVKNIR